MLGYTHQGPSESMKSSNPEVTVLMFQAGHMRITAHGDCGLRFSEGIIQTKRLAAFVPDSRIDCCHSLQLDRCFSLC